jgi:hypothetical protein
MKIKQILETSPETLALFGIDPEEARKEVEALNPVKFDGKDEDNLKAKNA